MEKIKTIQLKREDEKRWNKLLLNSVNSSYRQSMPFEYSKENKTRIIFTFIFEHNGEDIAGAHYSLKHSHYNIIKIADILSGFVFREKPNKEVLSFLTKHFLDWANDHKASYARINPWLPKIKDNVQTSYTSLFMSEMNNFGFTAIEKGRHTYWLDLTSSEDQLMKNMKRQTRYDIRQGAKSDIKIEYYEKPSDELFEIFWKLYSFLGNQKSFATLSKERFRKEVVSMMNSGLAMLFLSRFDGIVINASLASNFGEASYMYGAINQEFKKLKNCPSPGHISQWTMISTMKLRKLKIYDLGFAPGNIPVKDDPRYSIWRYKYGFGGQHVEFLPVYGKIIKPLHGRVFQIVKYKL
jgi:lipid II:glycine glycyltransferase (peptidoglycan interpeptide bridge formation enzyme)